MKKRIAVIGKAGHAGKIIRLLKERDDIELAHVYYPRPFTKNELPLTLNFEDVLSSDAVIISSPTHTHFEYLDRLRGFPGYILVEKPAVSTEEETEILRGFPDDFKERTRVNFNLIHSSLARCIHSVLEKKEFGLPVSFSSYLSHGLAFQAKYKNSWRGDVSQSLGVFETLGVHMIHLCSNFFGSILASNIDYQWVVEKGSSFPPDTVSLQLKVASGTSVYLLHSYATPRFTQVILIGTNGYWLYDGIKARFYSPRDTFSLNGRFVAPPEVYCDEFNFSEMWDKSLSISIDDFIDAVQTKRKFGFDEFNIALNAMKPVFKLQRELALPQG